MAGGRITRWAFLSEETGDWIEVKQGVVLARDAKRAPTPEELARALPLAFGRAPMPAYDLSSAIAILAAIEKGRQ
jgi:hypothetical protein